VGLGLVSGRDPGRENRGISPYKAELPRKNVDDIGDQLKARSPGSHEEKVGYMSSFGWLA